MRVLIGCFVMGVSLLAVSLTAGAQDIYKCPGRQGETIFSGTPCPGHASKPVLQITPGDIAAVQRHQDMGAIDTMLRQGRYNDAVAFANSVGLSLYLQQRAQQLQQQDITQQQEDASEAEEARQAAVAGLLDRNAQLSAQNRALRQSNYQQQSEYAAQQQQQNAAIQAQRMQQEAARQAEQATPKFNAATGQWCQDNGGFVSCH